MTHGLDGVSPEEIACLPIAEGMPYRAIEALARSASRSMAPEGRIFFHEAEPHHHLHVICHGIVTLEMRVPGHGTRKILTLGSGDLMAWSSIISEGVMTTTAIATTEVQTIDFESQSLRELCETNHEVGYHVMKQMASSLSKRLIATRLQLLDLFH